MGREEDKWVRLAQQGSRRAFDKIVRLYTPRIFRLLYDMTGSYEDAKDLTQEAFLKAYVNVRSFRGEAKFSTWLYRIAYNVAVDHKRKDGKMVRVDWESREKAGALKGYDPTDSGVYTGSREAIEAALQKLTPSQRTAVVLNYYHGFQMREIGDILGCSESTARVHLFRALRKLKDELKDFSPGA